MLRRFGMITVICCLLMPAAYADDALSHFLKGEDLYRSSQLASAADEFRQAVALDPKLKPAYYYLGLISRRRNRLGDALTNYQQFVALANADSPAERPMVVAVLRDIVEIARGLQRYDDAYAAAKRARELGVVIYGPDGLAALAAKAGHLPEVIAAAEQAVAAAPTDSSAYLDLYQAYLVANRKKDAVQLLQKAVQACPENAGLWSTLGAEYAADNRWNDAVVAYRNAVEDNPTDAQAIGKLAEALYNTGQLQEALVQADKSLAVNERYGADYNRDRLNETRNRIRSKLLTPEQFLKEAAAGIKALPTNPEAHRAYAQALEQLGRFDEAVSEQWTAYRLDHDARPLNEFETHLRNSRLYGPLARLVLTKLADPNLSFNQQSAIKEQFLTDLAASRTELPGLQMLDKQLKQTPNVAVLHDLRALVYERIDHNTSGAVDETLTASRLDGNWTRADQLQERLRTQSRYTDLANLLLARIMSIPLTPVLHSIAVNQYLYTISTAQIGEDAVKQLDAQLTKTPGVAILHGLRSLLYERVEHNLDGALAEQRKCVAAAPKSCDGHQRLGELLVQKNELNAALQEFATALALNPGNVWVLSQAADVQVKLDRPADAMETLHQMLEHSVDADNGITGAVTRLFSLAQKLNRIDFTRQRLERAANPAPDHNVCRRMALGEFAWLQGDHKAGDAVLDAVLQAPGADAARYLTVARFYQWADAADRVSAVCEAGMRAFPTSFDLTEFAFEHYRRQRQFDSALRVFKRLPEIQSNLNYPWWYRQLLQCYLDAGKQAEAVTFLEQRVKDHPDDDAAREILTEARRALAPGARTTTSAPGAGLTIWRFTTCTAEESTAQDGFAVRSEHELRVRIAFPPRLRGALVVRNVSAGTVSPPAQITSGATGQTVTWELESFQPTPDVWEFHVNSPIVREPCPIRGLAIERRAALLGNDLFSCEVTVQCPVPVTIKVRQPAGVEFEENSFLPSAFGSGGVFSLGQQSNAPRPLDCRAKQTFRFVCRSQGKPCLPRLEVTIFQRDLSTKTMAAGRGTAITSGDGSITLTEMTTSADNVYSYIIEQVFVPEQTVELPR